MISSPHPLLCRLLRTAALIPLLLAQVAFATDWQFAIPNGWTDLSPGQPIPKGVPADVAAGAQGGTYRTYAMDLQHPSRGFVTNLNVVVGHAPLVVNDHSLREFAVMVPSQAAREIPGASATVIEQKIVTIQGVPALRLVVDVRAPQATMRVLKFMLPGGTETAAITYTTTPSAYARYLPLFEAAAQQTQGAAAAPASAKIGAAILDTGGSNFTPEDRVKLLQLAGMLIGGAIGLTIVVVVQRRRKAASARADTTPSD